MVYPKSGKNAKAQSNNQLKLTAFAGFAAGSHDSCSRSVEADDTQSTTSVQQTPSAQLPASTSASTAGEDRVFQERWLNEFKWLIRASSGLMLCRLCKTYCANTVFAESGSENFQRSALVRHQNSKEHRVAQSMTDTATATDIREKIAEPAGLSSSVLGCMIDTAQFFITNELPDHKFSAVIDHMAKHGCEVLKTSAYNNRRGYEDMENALAEAAEEEIKELTAKTSFLGLMVDESVDISVHKNLIIYIKLLVNGEPKVVFGDNVSVRDGKAETIMNAIIQFMDDHQICFSKVVGFASDGANVMVGRISGVATRLKQINPNVITVHCAAHRLALAAFYGAKSCQPLIDFQRTVTQIYTFFEYSAVRYERLRELQAVLHVHVKKFKKPSSVRWLSLQEAVEALHQSWPVLVAVLEDEWKTRKTPEARGLAQKVNTFAFLAQACILIDVLQPLGKLSKIFQRDVIDVDVMNSMLITTVLAIGNMKDVDGQYMQDTADLLQTFNPSPVAKRTIQNLKKKYVTAVVSEIEKRLPQNSVCMLHDLNDTLNPKKLPEHAHAMNNHGKEQLQRIIDVYGKEVQVRGNRFPPIINSDRIKQDFYQFKCFLNGQRGKTLAIVCKELVKEDMRHMYPDFSVLAHLYLTLPLTSVPCERGFSQQNRIKNRLRNRMTTCKLARKMKVKTAACDLKLNLIPRAVESFESARKRVKLDSHTHTEGQ